MQTNNDTEFFRNNDTEFFRNNADVIFRHRRFLDFVADHFHPFCLHSSFRKNISSDPPSSSSWSLSALALSLIDLTFAAYNPDSPWRYRIAFSAALISAIAVIALKITIPYPWIFTASVLVTVLLLKKVPSYLQEANERAALNRSLLPVILGMKTTLTKIAEIPQKGVSVLTKITNIFGREAETSTKS